MLGDDDDQARRAIRAQADEDVAAFIAQLDSDVGSGVPPPPQIRVTEVSSQPYEFDLLARGDQGAGTAPSTTPGPIIGACCVDGECSVTTESECAGEWQGVGTDCSPNPCGVCCYSSGTCDDTIDQSFCEIDGGTWRTDVTSCDPNPCVGACCIGCAENIPACECTDALSYQDCLDSRPEGCSSAWLLDSICGEYGTEDDFCCTQFGEVSCPESCVTYGYCCCDGSIACNVATSEAECNAMCDPNAGHFFPTTTLAEAEAACDAGACYGACCINPPGTCVLEPIYPLGNTACTDLSGGVFLGPGTDCSPNPC